MQEEYAARKEQSRRGEAQGIECPTRGWLLPPFAEININEQKTGQKILHEIHNA